jgi:DNA-binding NtrC family response regulator
VGVDVLLVEDDVLLRSTFCELMGMAGLAVRDTASPAEALEILAEYKERPPVLVTDIDLRAKITGLHLGSLARMRNPVQAVIYVTGGYEALATRTYHPQLERVMIKPLQLAELLEAIEQSLRMSRSLALRVQRKSA